MGAPLEPLRARVQEIDSERLRTRPDIQAVARRMGVEVFEAEATKLGYDARDRFIADMDHVTRLDHMLSKNTWN